MEKKKSKQKKVISDEPTKQDYAIAKYMRFKGPSKKANMFGSKVQYFKASKMIDNLLLSKWAQADSKTSLFNTREACVEYLNLMLIKNFFHRVRKFVKIIELSEQEDSESNKGKNSKNIKDKDKNIDEITSEITNRDVETKSDNTDDGQTKAILRKRQKKKEQKIMDVKKKEKRRVKLELHEIQEFIDGPEQYYVWVYDPVPLKTWIYGFFIVIGAIVVCLFPLWPAMMRSGVYYLSLAGAGFLGLILFLALIRYVIFAVVWGFTMGRHHVWFLPNLLEDVGFVESFIPVYTHKFYGSKNVKKVRDKDGAATVKKRKSDKKPNEDVKSLCQDTNAQDITNEISNQETGTGKNHPDDADESNGNDKEQTISMNGSTENKSDSSGTKSQNSIHNNKNIAAAADNDFEIIEDNEMDQQSSSLIEKTVDK